MKNLFQKTLVILLLLGVYGAAIAQSTYTQVYIPTSFPSIGEGLNPYQTSSAVQKILLEKGIKSTFNKSTDAERFCEELQVSVEKENNMFRSKVNVKLIDCMGDVVWQNEGTGVSKDFVNGYAEAIADAMKELKKLPQPKKQMAQNTQPVRTLPAIASRNKIIYYSEKYIVELKDNTLIILNSEKLGYEAQQVIATLEPSDLEGLYEVKFTMSDGKVWNGLGMMKDDELSLSLRHDDEKQKIVLTKQ
ncbi:MAG: hypothetical protein ACK5LR_11200 [Mangrovibacterium sp.]